MWNGEKLASKMYCYGFSDIAFTMRVLIHPLSLTHIRSIPGNSFIFSGTAVLLITSITAYDLL